MATLSSARWVSERMNRETGSTAAAKPHGDGGHPWSIPLLAWMCAHDPSWCMRCVVEPVHHLEKTVASSGSPRQAVKHGSSADVLEGGLEVESCQEAGWVRFGEVLDGFEHLVGSVLASHAVLKRTRRCHDGWLLCGDDSFENESAQERHEEWPRGGASARRCWRTASGSVAVAM